MNLNELVFIHLTNTNDNCFGKIHKTHKSLQHKLWLSIDHHAKPSPWRNHMGIWWSHIQLNKVETCRDSNQLSCALEHSTLCAPWCYLLAKDSKMLVWGIFVYSRVIAEESVSSVLEGRNFNRAVHLQKLMCETLIRAAWDGFQPWLELVHPNAEADIAIAKEDICTFNEDISMKNQDNILRSAFCIKCTTASQSTSTFSISGKTMVIYLCFGCHI